VVDPGGQDADPARMLIKHVTGIDYISAEAALIHCTAGALAVAPMPVLPVACLLRKRGVF